MNRVQRKRLIQKWAPVLESDIRSPINCKDKASKVAVIIESEIKLNDGYRLN